MCQRDKVLFLSITMFYKPLQWVVLTPPIYDFMCMSDPVFFQGFSHDIKYWCHNNVHAFSKGYFSQIKCCYLIPKLGRRHVGLSSSSQKLSHGCDFILIPIYRRPSLQIFFRIYLTLTYTIVHYKYSSTSGSQVFYLQGPPQLRVYEWKWTCKDSICWSINSSICTRWVTDLLWPFRAISLCSSVSGNIIVSVCPW